MLDDNFILQSDAAVIAGILILLTVAYSLARRSEKEIVGEFAELTVKRISGLIIVVIIPFSISAILVVLGNVTGPYTIPISHSTFLAYYGKYFMPTNLGRYIMIIGFGALMVGIVALVWRKASKGFDTQPPGTRA